MITNESCRSKFTGSAWHKENYSHKYAYRKPKPQIQEKQVDKNRPKLGRGRGGIQHKHPQPVADTLVSANKSSKIPTNQKVTIDTTKFPVPNQLITHKAETITKRQVQDKNREQPCQPDPYFRPPPRPPDNL